MAYIFVLHDAENCMPKFEILWILQELEYCRFGARNVSFFLSSFFSRRFVVPLKYFFPIEAKSRKFGVRIPYDVFYGAF